ncbi:hypothetical protein [Helicobacter ibis]|uniref:Uncharacterized protein n=1 Tax=Helicobacter ibis TaxID=2962633 RepID=A0ABT4VFZ6_9HELI|nr:hypothetical protein [Helicobacter ibis]MDA3969636.1 hypothetical protein [Helicobacter ibis]
MAQNLEIYTNKKDEEYDKDTFCIYKMFDINILCVKKENSKDYIPSKYCSFYETTRTNYNTIYINNKDEPKISDKEISQKLRGSFTLKIDSDNCYDNPDIRVVFSEKGFLLQDNYGDQINKFESSLMMFILSLAYREKIESFLHRTANIINNKNHSDFISFKKDFDYFNLKYFLIIQYVITISKNMQYGKFCLNIMIYQ